jgi:hypothetical protein
MAQEGLAAVRARRRLGLHQEGDAEAVQALGRALSVQQSQDGAFEGSPMKTAGTLNLLDDLKATGAGKLIAAGASYLFRVLEGQPGYERARDVQAGSLREPCDLCGFFGPYEERDRPEVLAHGAREMNHYREYEPLLGPKAPVRDVRRSSLDRIGPASCYAWGLIPLCYTVEALCRAGHAHDPRLQPAIDALLGAQRESGGWCRNLGGHPACSIHAVRMLGSHPELRRNVHAERALRLMRTVQRGSGSAPASWWKGSNLFAATQAIAAFDRPISHEIIGEALAALAPRQRRDGTFGGPCAVERVVAVLVAARALSSS